MGLLRNSTVFFLCVSFPFRSFAEEHSQTSTGAFSVLQKGDMAKYSGVLFDPYAVGVILETPEFLKKSCELESNAKINKLQTKYDFDVSVLKSKNETDELVHKKELEAKDKEIKIFQNANKTTFWDAMLYIGTGFAIGSIAMGITIGLLK